MSLTLFCLQEGKTIKSSSGFKGKGFKFDETEAHLANERKKLQKAALGIADSDDEDAGMDVSMRCSLKRPEKYIKGSPQSYFHKYNFKQLTGTIFIVIDRLLLSVLTMRSEF